MNEMNGNEKQLLVSCLLGEADDFRKVVEKYRGKAMAVAVSILRNREDAEDACQETFVQVYKNRKNYDVQKNFSAWFFAILYLALRFFSFLPAASFAHTEQSSKEHREREGMLRTRRT